MIRRLAVAIAAALIVTASLPSTGTPAARTLAATGCLTLDNLVQNCGFESGLSSWTLSDSANSGVVGESDVTPWDGTSAFAGGSAPGSDTDVVTLTQTFTPTAGSAYLASFEWNGGDISASGGFLEASITFGTTTVDLGSVHSYDSVWNTESATFVGTGATATLTFRYHLKTTDRWFIDGVSVAPFAATVPDAPTLHQAVAQGAGKIGMNWALYGSEGGLELRGYNLYMGTAPGEEDYSAPLNGSTLFSPSQTAFLAEGLTGGQTYYFTVKAVNDLGESAASSETSAMAIDVPGAPTGVQAVAGNGSVTLSWTAPANDSGEAISTYYVYRGSSPETLTTLYWLAPGSAASATVTGLTNGTTYWFAVFGRNSVGDGALSDPVSATPYVAPTAPSAPSIDFDGLDNGSISVTWTAPANGGSVITGYNVYACEIPGCTTRANAEPLPATATSYTVEGLVPDGRSYYVYVTALNAVGESNRSAAVVTMALLKPSAPTDVTAVATLVGRRMTVDLTWADPSTSYAVDAYTVTVYEYRAPTKRNPDGLYRLQRVTYPASVQSVSITGLSAGKDFAFVVQAHNAAGWGDLSGYSNLVP